jgi:sigma-B regulation protein RsbU (phosphoserine phosphatase)
MTDKVDSLKKRFDLKELELNSLLEITQAINRNLPEESLYKIYGFTIRANLKIKKFALYVRDEHWECKANFGTDQDFELVPFDERLLDYETVEELKHTEKSAFSDFRLIIPIAHKDKKLAFALIGGFGQATNAKINTNFIQALSNIIIVAIENKKLARKQIQQEMIRRELEIAGNVQQFLFPKELPDKSDLKVSAFYKPHHSIGGDYYDFIEISDHQFLFCIADVSGKGIPAAILMSNFQASLRTLCRRTHLLQDIISELNNLIMSNAEGQHFITFFVVMYDTNTHRLKYVNAGHNPPFLIRPGRKIARMEEGTTILGAFKELPFLNVGVIEEIKRFTICAYTDGLSEMVDADQKEFGDGRLCEVVERNALLNPSQLNKAIIDEMEHFKGANSYIDDITLASCWVDQGVHIDN